MQGLGDLSVEETGGGGEELLGTWSRRGSVDVVTGASQEQRGARALTSKEHRGTWKLQEERWELVVSLLG